jgi:hypothetical protein
VAPINQNQRYFVGLNVIAYIVLKLLFENLASMSHIQATFVLL